MAAAGRDRRSGRSDVEVAVTDLGQVGEHGVEVVVHRQVAAGEAVAVAGGEPDQQLDGPARVGAAALARAR